MQDYQPQAATNLHTQKQDIRRDRFRLVIGDKNYSSWSMRPWVLMHAFDIPFVEVPIRLKQRNTSLQIAQYSSAGKVPVLLDDKTTVWDSLAICEYLAERFPDRKLWPADITARAVARSMCAEMHSGFSALRSAMSMDICGRYPGKGRTAESQADIARICEIWEDCLNHYAHSHAAYLFGEFTITDAYFAPVVTRFRTYGVSLPPMLQGYSERLLEHPAVLSWTEQAKIEYQTNGPYIE